MSKHPLESVGACCSAWGRTRELEKPKFVRSVYADMRDEDQMEVTLSQATFTIISHGNDLTWQVVAGLDTILLMCKRWHP